MQQKWKGALYGIVGAICYGTNPLGALFLYQEGVPTVSVLMYRFGFAALIIALVMTFSKMSFKVSLKELRICTLLGTLFGVSSLSLYSSFLYMDAGLASTLLFMYPILTAVLMGVFFKERLTLYTLFSIILAISGIVLLYDGGASSISIFGSVLVFISALSYAVYIVVVNAFNMKMGALKLSFFVKCSFFCFLHSLAKCLCYCLLLGHFFLRFYFLLFRLYFLLFLQQRQFAYRVLHQLPLWGH